MKAKIIEKNIMCQVYEKNSWLYWNISKSKIQKDSLAGSYHKSTGYYYVVINGKLYANHRILYQIYHNVILSETDVIDHHDRDRTNNKKENLRLDPNSKNSCNQKVQKNNKSSGIKNISIRKTKWCNYYHIKIVKNRKIVFSKLFRTDRFTEQEVIEIRDEQLKIHHGEFASFD